MADPSARRDVPRNPPSAFAAAAPAAGHPSPHYAPHVLLDPVAAAFYQRHLPAQQPLVSHPLPAAAQHAPVPQNHNPYYIPDMAAVALQQIHLQTMLHLQARHETQTSQQQQQQHPLAPHHTTATSPSSGPPILPIPPHMARALSANPAFIPPSLALPSTAIPQSAALPVVPEAQMASAYRIGRYTPAERKIRLERYREKRRQRNYNRRVKYDCRKQIADKRRRVQGRFVKREQEIALAASATTIAHPHPRPDQHRSSEATDATEDETKVQHPESSGSGSSTRHAAVNVGASSTNDRVTGPQQSFCEQSDQILRTFP